MCDFTLEEKVDLVLEIFPEAKSFLRQEIREFLRIQTFATTTVRPGKLSGLGTQKNCLIKCPQGISARNGQNEMVCYRGKFILEDAHREFIRAFGVEIEQRRNSYVKKAINPIGIITGMSIVRGNDQLYADVEMTLAFQEESRFVLFEPGTPVSTLIEDIRNISRDPKVLELLDNYPKGSRITS